ncbi:helix-turn-helix domain-containing protein [Clostridia bacterium OttesenSCG-928-O13]|nr:helix-turn-helix domain-containing protein [Clostridia bacterium OttesenSCG-928-O13]
MQGLKRARIEAGYTVQHKFAKALGIHPSDYNKMERGAFNPLPETYFDICHLTNKPPEAIARPHEVDYNIPIGNVPSKGKRPDKHKKRATLRARVLPRLRKQVDKDLKLLGISSVQAWIEQCVAQLHADAERRREHDA